MKYLLSLILLILMGCKPTEKIESTFENGNPEYMGFYNSKGELVARQEYYMNNVRKSKFDIQANKANGEYIGWNYEGRLEESGQMSQGLKSGEWTIWYDSNAPQWVGQFNKGKKQGAWKEFWYDGTLKRELIFENGDTVQTEKRFNPQGELRYFKSCHSGTGLIKKWSENQHLLLEAQCKNSKLSGRYRAFDEAKNLMLEAYYDQGVKDSVWSYYRNNFGLRRIESYQKGLRIGLQLEITRSRDTILNVDLKKGTGRLAYKCDLQRQVACADSSFVNGKLDGLVRRGSKNWEDKYSESIYKNGEKVSTSWFKKTEKGVFRSNLGSFKDEKKTGEWKTWYANGRLHSIQNYHEGELKGKETLFDSLGAITMEKIHSGKTQPIIINLK